MRQPLRTGSLVSSISSHSKLQGSRVISSPTPSLSRVPDLPLAVLASTEMPSPPYEYKVRALCTTPCTLQSAITISAGQTTLKPRQARARTNSQAEAEPVSPTSPRGDDPPPPPSHQTLGL